MENPTEVNEFLEAFMSPVCNLQDRYEHRRLFIVRDPGLIGHEIRPQFLISALIFMMLMAPAAASALDSFYAPFHMFDVPISGSIVAGDFNEDGCIDVVVTNRANQVGVLFGSCAGSLSTPWFSPTGVYPIDLVTADFDGDGHLDIATANKDGL